MTRVDVAIVGAGAYGLSLAAHLEARGISYRILGKPMHFWSNLAGAGGQRYLKSYCFGADLSTPTTGYAFADFSRPRGLETFEPCLIRDFVSYGNWFQERNVPRVEPINVTNLKRLKNSFSIMLASGEWFIADNVVLATGLANFAQVPTVLNSLPTDIVTHTSEIRVFSAFRGLSVAVVGAGQSALEAAALLLEAGAHPHLLIRGRAIQWQSRVFQRRSFWRHIRSPISKLGTGPKAWALTHLPGATHRLPAMWRAGFVKRHLLPEGAWWLRDRVENRMPIKLGATLVEARLNCGRALLKLRTVNEVGDSELQVDRVIAGTGYRVDVENLNFIDPELRRNIQVFERAPKLRASFETTVPKLYMIGPASAMSFGPLFRFVAGAEYAARNISAHLERRLTGC